MIPNFNKGKLKHVVGDALLPEAVGTRYVIHICNDIGAWGAGFTGAVTARWKTPELQYRTAFSNRPLPLGDVQFVSVQSDLVIVNMIAQHGIGTDGVRVDYDALKTCLDKVSKHVKDEGNGTIHSPRIGAGLGGGDWDAVESILNDKLVEKGLNVWVYTLPNEVNKFKKSL